MRFINKYKLSNKFSSGIIKSPVRILKFKRPKWQKTKKILLKIQQFLRQKVKKKSKLIRFFLKRKSRKVFIRKKKYYFRKKRKVSYDYNVLFSINKYVDHLRIVCNKNKVCRVKKTYSSKLNMRKYLFSMYDKSITIIPSKKEKKRLNALNSVLTRPLFRLDILLWYLKFFASMSASRQCINRGSVFVNNKIGQSNYFLKKGDILSFKIPTDLYKLNRYKIITKKFFNIRHFFPFIEYDYYTNSFIVLKNWDELTRNDLTLIFSEYKNLKPVMYK